MVILIGGSTHTGKTNLSQKLLEKYMYPYVSIDHIKMGLIRSGMIDADVDDDDGLTRVLWPVICDMIKTVVENGQNVIIEGCYIPYNWKNDFDGDYLKDIEGVYLVMSDEYIKNHFAEIRKYAGIIEGRGEDDGCTIENILRYNAECREMCEKYGCRYILIDGAYDIDYLIDNIAAMLHE